MNEISTPVPQLFLGHTTEVTFLQGEDKVSQCENV